MEAQRNTQVYKKTKALALMLLSYQMVAFAKLLSMRSA